MACQLGNAKDELEQPFEPLGMYGDMFEDLFWYARGVSGIAKDYADTVSVIREEYKWLCACQAAYITLRRELWKAHYQLFRVCAYVSGADFPADYVCSHHKVLGDIQTQVKIGTYVHVDDGVVYSDGVCPVVMTLSMTMTFLTVGGMVSSKLGSLMIVWIRSAVSSQLLFGERATIVQVGLMTMST